MIIPNLLGKLSSKSESNGNPAAIGYDGPGGWSYGSYQISTGTGTFAAFLEFAREKNPAIAAQLDQAGGLEAAKAGTPKEKNAANMAFQMIWKRIAFIYPKEFQELQHAFIVDSHYGAAMRVLTQAGCELEERTQALGEVIFSLAVAAGPGSCTPNKHGVRPGCAGLVYDAILASGRILHTMSDRTLISTIYDEKLERIDTGKEYSTQTEKIRDSVRKRFASEKLSALTMLDFEQLPKAA